MRAALLGRTLCEEVGRAHVWEDEEDEDVQSIYRENSNLQA